MWGSVRGHMGSFLAEDVLFYTGEWVWLVGVA